LIRGNGEDDRVLEIRRILEELVCDELPHWKVVKVGEPLMAADRDVEYVTVVFQISG
jgi:hypothetical protein